MNIKNKIEIIHKLSVFTDDQNTHNYRENRKNNKKLKAKLQYS